VADSGEGMTAEVLAKAFEPFFTTKEVGKGTGLGLSQVYGLARQSGGTVRIRSKPGAGTEVDIYVPRALGASKPEQPQAAGDVGEATVRRGTVLIVDDQEEVREIAAIHLEALGYEIIQAANGRAALDLLEVGGTPVMDVLLVDYAMPGISGAEVIRAARQARPNLPAVLMTGYADADLIQFLLSIGIRFRVDSRWRDRARRRGRAILRVARDRREKHQRDSCRHRRKA
jgi:CheY-like chemotaxis protein